MIEKKQFYTFKPFNGFNIFKAPKGVVINE